MAFVIVIALMMRVYYDTGSMVMVVMAVIILVLIVM